MSKTNTSNHIVFSGSNGTLDFISEDSSQKSVPLSNSALNTPTAAPDGKVWTTDTKGKLYIYDPSKQTKQFMDLDLSEMNQIVTIDKRTSNIVFFKDGGYALEFGGVFIFIQQTISLKIFLIKRKRVNPSQTQCSMQMAP